MSIEMEMVKEHQRAIELIQDLISMGMRSDSSEERIKTFRKLDKYIHANMFKEIKKCGYCEEDFLAGYKQTLYCNEVCKDLKALERRNSDPLMSQHYKIYKKKHNIMERNIHSPKAIKEWEGWRDKSKIMKARYKEGGISKEEFKAWLDNE
jgi:hypothetical protein